jgi:hypothetical protein
VEGGEGREGREGRERREGRGEGGERNGQVASILRGSRREGMAKVSSLLSPAASKETIQHLDQVDKALDQISGALVIFKFFKLIFNFF